MCNDIYVDKKHRYDDKRGVLPSWRCAGCVDTVSEEVISESQLENIVEINCDAPSQDLPWHDLAASDLHCKCAVCWLALAQAHVMPLSRWHACILGWLYYRALVSHCHIHARSSNLVCLYSWPNSNPNWVSPLDFALNLYHSPYWTFVLTASFLSYALSPFS